MKLWEIKSTARQQFERETYRARYGWRCDVQRLKQIHHFDDLLVIDGIADIAQLRLQQAMLPLTDALDRFIHSVQYLERSI